MKYLRIALLQISPAETTEGNLGKGIAACRTAKEMGADMALFPEMYSCGYDSCCKPAEEWVKDAIAPDDRFVLTFGKLAAELDCLHPPACAR